MFFPDFITTDAEKLLSNPTEIDGAQAGGMTRCTTPHQLMTTIIMVP
jgi:hypothetical protein